MSSAFLRRRVGAALAIAATLAAVGAPLAEGACGRAKHVRASRNLTPGPPPLAVGDSVLLGALDEAARAGFEVDTRGCRQIGEGLRVLRKRRRAGRLPRFVVLALGANLPSIGFADIRTALGVLGRKRVLGLVTPRQTGGRVGAATRVIRAAPRRFGRRVLVLDWVAYSAGRGGWFAEDGIHLGPGGAAGLGRLLGRGLRKLHPRVARLGRGIPVSRFR